MWLFCKQSKCKNTDHEFAFVKDARSAKWCQCLKDSEKYVIQCQNFTLTERQKDIMLAWRATPSRN